MKLVRYADPSGKPRLGLKSERGIHDLADRIDGLPETLTGLLARRAEFDDALMRVALDPGIAVENAPLLAPIARPGKIFAIGLNYADHVAETGMPMPPEQIWFTKPPSAVNGPFDDVEAPAVSDELDYEAELVLVIGRRCRNVPAERAHEVVGGYTVGNDYSVRDWQRRSTQWVIGKSFDTHAAFGPWISTPDEVDPAALNIRCLVNGEVRQSSNTRHLIFGVYDQIAQLSQAMTLEPGDVIFTGTPGGVGAGFKPPKYLRAGDVVRTEIDGLGFMENRIVAGPRETTID